jgi:hypothetical protein
VKVHEYLPLAAQLFRGRNSNERIGFAGRQPTAAFKYTGAFGFKWRAAAILVAVAAAFASFAAASAARDAASASDTDSLNAAARRASAFL